MNEWNIQGRAHGCEACGRSFVDKQVYHTLLFDEKQLFRRVDVCEACWLAQFGQGAMDRKGFVSHWQGRYEAPAPRPEVIQRENAESLLRRLIERGDARYEPAAYILAVMLERKRILKVKEQFFRDGRRSFLYEHAGSGDLFTIPDPALQLNQLEQVQRDVADLLEHGLPSPESAPGPAAVTAEPVPPTAEPAAAESELAAVAPDPPPSPS